ncbi:MAG: hypothetical protein Q8878_07030 [Bacillota bacterium]|nr:hypothetical protein [Bacillota bacterium]
MSVAMLMTLLGLDSSKEQFAEFAYSQAEDIIKNHCRIGNIPAELKNVALSMAMDLYRAQNLGDEAPALGSVKTITEGEASVAFRSAAGSTDERYAENPGVTFLKNYEKQLERFRKPGW